ncbi:enoyl-CoA hydratase [Bacillus swezeyi]|uniref:enoyl-CoA hydratase n=1 Tax=Bacillus swezeyi TaxID=1925020 RepID=UPI0027DEA43B|nr:enoyl-CoA hydratase [Bacillus swezeyi]
MDYIKWKDHGEMFEIVLNRPEAYNALNEQMLEELKEALILAGETEAMLLLIKGSGKGFSAGGDINMMMSSADEKLSETVIDTISEVVMMIYSMPKITVAAVHGAAAGLGMSLALSCDHVLAEKGAKLAMNFIGIGLVPDGGGHFFLERRIGERAAKELIWSGKKLTADEAQRLQLVDAVFSGDLDRHTGSHLEKLLQSPLSAMIETKKIYQTLNAGHLQKTLELEKTAQIKMRRTNDHQEGIRAFLEKRKPRFNQKLT